MKRIVISLLLLTIVTSFGFSLSGSIGFKTAYEPADRNLFKFNGFSYKDDIIFGVSYKTDFLKDLLFSIDTYPISLKEGSVYIETVPTVFYKHTLQNGYSVNAGVGIAFTAINAISESNKIYLTLNGVALSSIKKLYKNHWLSLVGAIRPSFSVQKEINSKFSIGLDYTLNLFPYARDFPNADIFNYLGMGRIAVCCYVNI